MKEHPILFTGPMVRAILEGRKTQTRRPVKVPKGLKAGFYRKDGSPQWVDAPCYWEFVAVREDFDGLLRQGDPPFERFEIKAPFAVGDRLWVRETWCQQADSLTDRLIGKAHYAADGYEVHNVGGLERSPWRPSIHMPRWASRLTLEVTDIRPERVQDITEADAIAEGVRFFPDLSPDPTFRPSGPHCRWSMYEPKTDAECLGSAAFAFGNAWNHIYGKGPLVWRNNPWVWATTFKVVTP